MHLLLESHNNGLNEPALTLFGDTAGPPLQSGTHIAAAAPVSLLQEEVWDPSGWGLGDVCVPRGPTTARWLCRTNGVSTALFIPLLSRDVVCREISWWFRTPSGVCIMCPIKTQEYNKSPLCVCVFSLRGESRVRNDKVRRCFKSELFLIPALLSPTSAHSIHLWNSLWNSTVVEKGKIIPEFI